jgi:hypothetical protein
MRAYQADAARCFPRAVVGGLHLGGHQTSPQHAHGWCVTVRMLLSNASQSSARESTLQPETTTEACMHALESDGAGCHGCACS